MRTIYIDSNFKCHISDDGTMTAVETDYFDGKCDAFVEGYRLIPAGEVWTREDGVAFHGEMIAPWKPWDELDAAQREYERELLAEYAEALKVVGGDFMTVMEQAQAIREAMDVAGANLTEEQALVCVRLYRPWETGKAYAVGEYLTYGVNGVGDPQLYKVVQAHTSQSDWTPDATPALYSAIGLDDSGYPVWAQPTGAHDAYNKGDIVNYNGTLYQSLIDGNVYSPDAYPAGWEAVTG